MLHSLRKCLVIAVLAVIAVGSAAHAMPVIGDNLVHSQSDVFQDGGWTLNVYSYVFNADSTLPDLGVSALDQDEMLFVYLLGMEQASTGAVNLFSVGNPDEIAINTIGYSDDALPATIDSSVIQNPSFMGSNPYSNDISFVYNFVAGNPSVVLEPGEWSLVYYVAETDTWSLVDATASGGGVSDDQKLPGAAVPEPATLALLSVGGLVLARRRK